MTDHAKNLADAARELLKDTHPADHGCFHVCNYVVDDLQDALAAFDAAQVPPSDAEIESSIDAFRDACHRHAREAVLGADDDEPSAAVDAKDAREALVSLMRRARPVVAVAEKKP